MRNFLSIGVVTILVIWVGIFAFASINQANPTATEEPEIVKAKDPSDTLQAFASQAELENYLRELLKKWSERPIFNSNTVVNPSVMETGAAPSTSLSKSVVKDEESVTNTQHAGVDEGGIVKLHKNHLVILRRGRLFTVAVGDNSLRPVSKIDAFAPDINPNETWYDEMIISNNTIAVIGYSYDRGGTEIGLFKIDDEGGLKYRSTYHLRSNDYYSSRNYATRLIDGKLIFYTPQYLWIDRLNPTQSFPAVRRWRRGVTERDYRSIVSPNRIYRPANEIGDPYGMALHTVTVCDLESDDFGCRATGVIGPAGRVFYVSPKSVYVWATDWSYARDSTRSRSTLYKMPLDGSAPSALGVAGSPIDQFSFLESNDGFLNVLVRSEAGGDGMWEAEITGGETALMRISTKDFSDGKKQVPASAYIELPKVKGYTVQNRFVGDYLLYGSGNSWNYAEPKNRATLIAVKWKTGKIDEISLKHSVDRIEAMGKDAVVVGSDGKNLHFSTIDLDATARFGSGYIRKNATQGELRSHGFFYKSEDSESGLLGLPIRNGGSAGYESLYSDSASILFLRNHSLNLKELGDLKSRPIRQYRDNCKASCVDWYGNARPLFVNGRIFGLLGYEIVEGEVNGDEIIERRRVNFAPAS